MSCDVYWILNSCQGYPEAFFELCTWLKGSKGMQVRILSSWETGRDDKAWPRCPQLAPLLFCLCIGTYTHTCYASTLGSAWRAMVINASSHPGSCDSQSTIECWGSKTSNSSLRGNVNYWQPTPFKRHIKQQRAFLKQAHLLLEQFLFPAY